MNMKMTQTSMFSEQAESALPLRSRPRIEDSEPHWYAAYTRANYEKGVTQQLQRTSVECFLPLYESVRRWTDRQVRLQLPLFPGYVFVRLALRDRLQVLQIHGVVRLVGFDHHPCSLPEGDIEVIRTRLAGTYRMEPHPYLQSGSRVRVLSGPLGGLTGIVLRQKNRTRFVISLELLMRSVAVDIDSADFDLHATPLT